MVLFDEWFEWLVTESWDSVVYFYRTIPLQDDLSAGRYACMS